MKEVNMMIKAIVVDDEWYNAVEVVELIEKNRFYACRKAI